MRVLHAIPSAKGRVGGIEVVLDFFRERFPKARMWEEPDEEAVRWAEVVHVHGVWNPAHRKVFEACMRWGVPWVISPHGMLEPWARRHRWWKKWIYFRWIEREHLARAAALHATSKLEQKHLGELFPEQRIDVITPCVMEKVEPDYSGARARLGWRQNEFILLFLSRLHPKKGLHVLIEALGPLGKLVDRPMRLVIAGGGEPRYVRRCREQAQRYRLNADWPGPIWGAARWDYLRAADLFCLPTFSENFGVAVLEALQVGTQTLTTMATPWGEFGIENGLVLSEPEVEEVRAHLSAILDGPGWSEEDRHRLSRVVYETFGQVKSERAWKRFYEAIRGRSSVG